MGKHTQLANFIRTTAAKAQLEGEPFVINFADGNHVNGMSQSALADPEVMQAMKDTGMTLIMEGGGKRLSSEYEHIKEEVANNQNYSVDDYYARAIRNGEKIEPMYRASGELLISSAKSDVELKPVDNSETAIAPEDRRVAVFIQRNASILAKGHQECAVPLSEGLISRLPPEALNSIGNILQKREGGAEVNVMVAAAVNSEKDSRNNAGVLYGAAHFEQRNDIDDIEVARIKPTILIATDNDLAKIFAKAKLYESDDAQLPEYRYNPDTGEVSYFNNWQVKIAKSNVAEREEKGARGEKSGGQLTAEQCMALIPPDLKFKPYSPQAASEVELGNKPSPQWREPPSLTEQTRSL